ncbi:MAG: hypothetical protein GC208_01510 [Alphaproteobacteria bacterium]|nr:hypothetical protein [Alphaproteobacteria bacterium]
MKRLMISAAVLPFLAGSALATDFAPQSGSVIAFDVMRGDSPMGTHTITFERDGDRLVATTDVDLRVSFGPVTFFRYEHEAREVWMGDRLVSFSSETLKDGNDLEVAAERAGDELAIDGMTYEEEPVSLTLPATLALSSHWRGYDPEASVIFNTETGQEMEVEIEEVGTETITVMGREIEARRIRMAGSLTVDLWYGPDDEWVKCAFEARGETITYVRRDA